MLPAAAGLLALAQLSRLKLLLLLLLLQPVGFISTTSNVYRPDPVHHSQDIWCWRKAECLFELELLGLSIW